MRLLLAVLLFAGAGMAYLAMQQASNCGGNSAALSVCHNFVAEVMYRYVRSESLEPSQKTIDTLTSDMSAETLASLFDLGFVNATYSIRSPELVLVPSRKEILIVCDSEFDNVPQPTIWNLYMRSPAHAVGYSDGSTGLINSDEYGRINRAEFVPASTWTKTRLQMMSGAGQMKD